MACAAGVSQIWIERSVESDLGWTVQRDLTHCSLSCKIIKKHNIKLFEAGQPTNQIETNSCTCVEQKRFNSLV